MGVESSQPVNAMNGGEKEMERGNGEQNQSVRAKTDGKRYWKGEMETRNQSASQRDEQMGKEMGRGNGKQKAVSQPML